MAEENRLFQVEIITPDRVFYTGEGDMIEFTTASGEIGVYKKHIPLTTVLAPAFTTPAAIVPTPVEETNFTLILAYGLTCFKS